MSQPDWLNEEDKRAGELTKSKNFVSNPTAPKPSPRSKKSEPLKRSLKGFRFRVDYQQTFDTLVAEQKHSSGKKGPDLIEEALSMLFKKYKKL